nr:MULTISPECIES: hypothetical protein [unclassified Nocardia]
MVLSRESEVWKTPHSGGDLESKVAVGKGQLIEAMLCGADLLTRWIRGRNIARGNRKLGETIYDHAHRFGMHTGGAECRRLLSINPAIDCAHPAGTLAIDHAHRVRDCVAACLMQADQLVCGLEHWMVNSYRPGARFKKHVFRRPTSASLDFATTSAV